MLDGLPKADWLLGDRGYDADWFRDALEEKARDCQKFRVRAGV